MSGQCAWQRGMHGHGGVHEQGGMHGQGGVHAMHTPPDTMRYSRLVNARAVRILLECILVENKDITDK